jgi:hypothetical protein
MNHLALGFKLKKKMGMAFGITPYAAKGYYLSEKITDIQRPVVR